MEQKKQPRRLFGPEPGKRYLAAVFDMDGPQAAATRRKLLDMVSAEKMQVAFYHAPFPATGHIAKDGNGFELVPVQWSSAI